MKRLMLLLLGITYSVISMSQTYNALYFYHDDSLVLVRDCVHSISFEKDENGAYQQVIERIFDDPGHFFTENNYWGKDTLRFSHSISTGDRIEISEKPFLRCVNKNIYSMLPEFWVLFDTNLEGADSDWDVSHIKYRILSGNKDEIKILNGSAHDYEHHSHEIRFDYSKGFWAGIDEDMEPIAQFEIEIYDDLYGCRDTVNVVIDTSFGVTLASALFTCQPSGGICEYPLVGGASIPEIQTKTPDFIKRLPDRIEGNDRIIRLEFSANDSEYGRGSSSNLENTEPNNIYFRTDMTSIMGGIVYQPGKGSPSFDEQKEALVALYNATDGAHWKNNQNWLSDKPVSEWYGVNKCGGGWTPHIYGNYVLALNLENNRLCGQLPSEFSKLMVAPRGLFGVDNYEDLGMDNYEFSSNYIYGDIPDDVKNHPNWSEGIGWDLIHQLTTSLPSVYLPFTNEGLNQTDNRIRTKDSPITLFVEEKESTVYDILKQNELTLVIDMGSVYDDAGIRYEDGNSISEDRVNLYLDYCNKGLGMVAVLGTYGDCSFDEYGEFVKQRQKDEGFPTGIRWVKDGFGDAIHKFNNSMGDIRLLDKDGNLVHSWLRVWGPEEAKYNAQADSIIRSILGEPEEHEKFTSYQSTDYSRDGEVMVLQKATVGKGVDVVFMGDLFLDKDMETGGKYETTMREGMEMLFSTEPFKSLRDRFNVYAVKVVAKNVTTPVYTHLENSDDFCFQYAERIESVSRDNVSIISISSNRIDNVAGESNMFYENSSVSYIYTGVGSVLLHEFGHGFGKLFDEYHWGDEVAEENREDAYDEIRHYHDKGWAMNVSTTDNPELVPWTHFLKDSRYTDEIGIYEGALGWTVGLWRPSPNSLMTNYWDELWYNAPSREAIYKRVMQQSEGEGWTYDYEKFVEFDAPAREAHKKANEAESPIRKAQKQQVDTPSPNVFEKVWYDIGHNTKMHSPIKTR